MEELDSRLNVLKISRGLRNGMETSPKFNLVDFHDFGT